MTPTPPRAVRASANPRPLRMRTGLAGLAVLGAVGLTGCGAGFDAQTNQVRVPADGVPAEAGSIKILNALLVSDGEQPGAVLSFSVANTAVPGPAGSVPDDQEVTLRAVTSGEAQAQITGETEVDAGTQLRVGAEDGAAAVFISGEFEPGTYVPLTITLTTSTGTVDIPIEGAPVMPPTDYYADYAVDPEPEVSEPPIFESPEPGLEGEPSGEEPDDVGPEPGESVSPAAPGEEDEPVEPSAEPELEE